jgi:hypothetical protein
VPQHFLAGVEAGLRIFRRLEPAAGFVERDQDPALGIEAAFGSIVEA